VGAITVLDCQEGAPVSNIGPCQYPGCRDVDGNPRLTRDVICLPSRRHYATIIDRLALHWVLIRRDLPAPAAPPAEKLMRVQTKVYGHPREWASDAARAIADQLSEAHDNLAEHLGHDGPPWQGHIEVRRVVVSHHYLVSWFDRLCSMPGAGDVAETLYDLDRDVRRGLGKTDPQRHLPTPCPQCELLTLVRSLESDGTDEVECRACGHVIHAEHYGLWTRMILDDLLGDALNEDADDNAEAS